MKRCCAPLIFMLLALPAQGEETPFSAVVRTHFKSWDKDHDGVLSHEELDEAMLDTGVKGDAAAALGAIKDVQRDNTYNKKSTPPFTLDALAEYEAEVAHKKNPVNRYDVIFKRNKAKLDSIKRKLFTDGLPHLGSIHQGADIGDCYFIAVVGAMVARNGEEVRDFIKQNSNGTVTVQFHGASAVTISPPTDTELAVDSTTGRDGIWLPTLEKAFGALRNKHRAADKKAEEPTDTIANGGSTASSVELLTGHDSWGRDIPWSNRDEAEKLLPRIRQELKAAHKDNRVAATSTPAHVTMPPGMNAGHVYAVLGYDADKDRIRLWNPFGNDHTPNKGAEGIANGYDTRDGKFSVPLSDYVLLFNGLCIESSDPAKHKL